MVLNYFQTKDNFVLNRQLKNKIKERILLWFFLISVFFYFSELIV